MFTRREKCPWGYAVALAKFLGATRIIQDSENVYPPWKMPLRLCGSARKIFGSNERVIQDSENVYPPWKMPLRLCGSARKIFGSNENYPG